MSQAVLTSERLTKVQRPALVVGLIASVLCGVGAAFGIEQLLRSYLLAHLFWWGVAVGCLGLTMLNHLVGGRWGYKTRPILTAGIMTFPLLAVLFIPLALGLKYIYVWADPQVVAADPRLQEKAVYLDPWFFRIRAIGYFVVWILIGLYFSKSRVSRAADPADSHNSAVCGLAILVLVLSVSFAAMDWAMSLDPHWYSTIYGALIAVGGILTAMSLVAGVVALGGAGSLEDETNLQVLHDLGSLLLAFVMLWSYFAFSQFLIIWSGNLPDESRWYLHRLDGGWQWVGILIVVFHFIVPFALLLSREQKRSAPAMIRIAGLILLIHYVELFWNVAPAFSHSQFTIHWLDLVAPVAIGGVWLYVFLWQLKRRLALTGA